jgi:hypothetical protein
MSIDPAGGGHRDRTPSHPLVTSRLRRVQWLEGTALVTVPQPHTFITISL